MSAMSLRCECTINREGSPCASSHLGLAGLLRLHPGLLPRVATGRTLSVGRAGPAGVSSRDRHCPEQTALALTLVRKTVPLPGPFGWSRNQTDQTDYRETKPEFN